MGIPCPRRDVLVLDGSVPQPPGQHDTGLSPRYGNGSLFAPLPHLYPEGNHATQKFMLMCLVGNFTCTCDSNKKM